MMVVLLALMITLASSWGFLSGFTGSSSESSDSSETGTIDMDTINDLRDDLIPIIIATGLGGSGIPNWDRFKEDKHPLIAGLA